MRRIDADAKITALLYDEEHEETNRVEMTIADFLDSHTEEGCPQNGGWISVKDRLPDSKGQYLVAATQAGHYRHITIVSFTDHFVMNGHRTYWRVTHWMKLPDFPEEGKDNG